MAICEIKEKINHKKIWKLRSVNFPNIFIDIFGLDGGIALTLCLHMPNWDFQPPSAIMLHPKLNRLSYSIEVPPSVEFGMCKQSVAISWLTLRNFFFYDLFFL